MKVVCINNYTGSKSYLPLTIGKIYKCDLGPRMYWIGSSGSSLYNYIKNDIGEVRSYDSWRFISLEEWREKQLNELGIV